MSGTDLQSDDFAGVYERIRAVLRRGRNQALQAVNAEMVRAY